MPDVFSKRMRRSREGEPAAYSYDELPNSLRVQIVHIWRATIGEVRGARAYDGSNRMQTLWTKFRDKLRLERGVFYLTLESVYDEEEEVKKYFLAETNAEKALDVVEVLFGFVHDNATRWNHAVEPMHVKQAPPDALRELNKRFKEHGIGYQFESGQIIRMDSQFAHHAVVSPALALLREPAWAGPNVEFLRAHEHHRFGEEEECLVDCLKAFESTMKVICDRRRWDYEPTATASKLIKLIFDNKLLPDHIQSEMTALRAVLESGVPTVRNKTAGHGQGGTVRTVPAYVAAFVLHSTAANILLLVEAHQASPTVAPSSATSV